MREITNHPEPKVTILFDVNMPHLDDCYQGCQYNKDHNCVHRFDFPVRVIYLQRQETSFSDFKILIAYFKWVKFTGNTGDFFLVTKDRNFIKDAKREYRPPRRNSMRLRIDFKKSLVQTSEACLVLKKFKGNNRQRLIRQLLQLKMP